MTRQNKSSYHLSLKYLYLILISFTVSATPNLSNDVQIKLVKSVDELRATSGPVVSFRNIINPSAEALQKIFEKESTKINSKLSSAKVARLITGKRTFQNGSINMLATGGDRETNKVDKLSKIGLNAARTLLNMNGYEAYGHVNDVLEQYEAPKEYCPFTSHKPYCDYAYPYRMMDGSCNNIENPTWGMSKSPFKRLLNPEYDDYLNEPRTRSYNGATLPNPRTIAMIIHHPKKEPSSHFTNLLPHFGQFVDHDCTLTALTSDEDGTPIKCFCNNDREPDCININMPKDDRINIDQRCMVTPRSSASYKHKNCRLGHREQLNLLTHWLDLSGVYGNDIKKSISLRSLSDGLLNSSMIKGIKRDYLPFDMDGNCLNIPKGKPCFISGDIRTNQNLVLTSIQTIWMREHNRIAAALGKLNRRWSDEKLYQEARRINIAQYQHIVYNEWLPALISFKVAKLYGLMPLNQDYFYRYDRKLYPAVMNEFSTAAFRYGHTLVRDTFTKTDMNYKTFEKTKLSDIVFSSFNAFKKGGLDSYARGCLVDRAMSFNSNLNGGLNDHLFEGLNKDIPTVRFSLSALNINRGRDHGIIGYNHYRALCGLNYAKSFEDFHNIPKDIREKLAKVYDHVDDIDLFTGGTSEFSIEGGAVGPTFACIIAKQFRDLKFGDRFYYENGGLYSTTKFTVKQLDEIRKSSHARILCDNTDVHYLQRNVFLEPDFQINPLVSCSNVPEVDLSAWKSYETE